MNLKFYESVPLRNTTRKQLVEPEFDTRCNEQATPTQLIICREAIDRSTEFGLPELKNTSPVIDMHEGERKCGIAVSQRVVAFWGPS